MALWLTAAAGLLLAVAALMHSRRTARRLAEVTHMYWALKFEHGELKARVAPAEPAAPAPKTSFVPLSSIKKS
jgi:hypothetical protein